MDQIIKATQYTIATLRQSADAILEVDAATTYFGFCKKGTLAETDHTWSIMQVTQTDPGQAGNKILFKWAGGQCNYAFQFSAAAGYTYYFKKF